MNLMIVPGMFVCSSFLLVYVCLLCESFAHIECYSDCSCRGSLWLNPFVTVLFSLCSAVTVECCVLYPCGMGLFGKFAVM